MEFEQTCCYMANAVLSIWNTHLREGGPALEELIVWLGVDTITVQRNEGVLCRRRSWRWKIRQEGSEKTGLPHRRCKLGLNKKWHVQRYGGVGSVSVDCQWCASDRFPCEAVRYGAGLKAVRSQGGILNQKVTWAKFSKSTMAARPRPRQIAQPSSFYPWQIFSFCFLPILGIAQINSMESINVFPLQISNFRVFSIRPRGKRGWWGKMDVLSTCLLSILVDWSTIPLSEMALSSRRALPLGNLVK